MDIKLPDEIDNIISTLEANGHEAYIVGGCVRDSLMGRIPKDYDVTTSALPEQIRAAFKDRIIIDLGLEYGTVALLPHQCPYIPIEITTFRLDGTYYNNRHPDFVTFTDSLKEDLSRRDFTINSLAYNQKTGIVDLFGGKDDLLNRLIKCVGNPDKRFQEDALRIMRAMRFASVLGFAIDTDTSRAMLDNKQLLQNISKERIANELNRMIIGQDIGEILLNHRYVFAEIIPEIVPMFGFLQNNPHHIFDVYLHTIYSINCAVRDVVIRLALLFHDIAKPAHYTEADGIGHFYGHPQTSSDIAKEVLIRLKYDNNTINQVTQLVLYHDAELEPSNKHVKRWLNRIGEHRLWQMIEVKKADAMAQAPSSCREKMKKLNQLPDIIKEIVQQQQCFSLKNLAINGNDLIDMGIPEGTKIGAILNKLVNIVIDETMENKKVILLEEAKKLEKEIDNEINYN